MMRRERPRRDEDGTCTVCGLEWENPEEYEFHECPPGFGQKPVPTAHATEVKSKYDA